MVTLDYNREAGAELYQLACKLFPLCRSLTGDGVRKSFEILEQFYTGFTVSEVPSGTECFDWTVPPEWNVRAAFIEDEAGKRIVDFAVNNLHLVGYSIPFAGVVDLEELQKHLFSLPEKPDVVPYVTSYYERRWGFCLSDKLRKSLSPGNYRVVVDTTLAPGSLTYGQYYIPGDTTDEILLSTYVCHPSMANNETSGICLLAGLIKEVSSWKSRKYSYRFLFVPETIGAIAYISQHLADLRSKVKAGFEVTCVGDTRAFTYLPSRKGNTIADRAAQHVLRHVDPQYIRCSFLNRGSDERQFCSPGVDLPLCSVMRSRYATYPEYHTSLDDLSLISAQGLGESLEMYKRILLTLESNIRFTTPIICEPFLSKHGLYRSLGIGGEALENELQYIFDLLAFADGETDLIEISEQIGCSIFSLLPVLQRMLSAKVLVKVSD